MTVDHIRYDILTQDALRDVVRTVLLDVAKNGLPGDHHFYVSFDTRAPGVRLSSRMRAQYPKEMTIVLQHQFWDLAVTDTALEVGLSFGGVPERLAVPFAAIKGFFDPSVQFGLQFEEAEVEEEATLEPQPTPQPTPQPSVSTRPPAERRPPRTPPSVGVIPEPANPEPAKPQPAPAANVEDHPSDQPQGGAEVVRLDRFRKK